MDTFEILIRLGLGGLLVFNGLTGMVRKRTQFSIGRKAPEGPATFHGAAAVLFGGAVVLSGLIFSAPPLYVLLFPDKTMAEDTPIMATFLAFAVLFLGVICSAVVQFAVSLGESYRATMDRDSTASDEDSPPKSE